MPLMTGAALREWAHNEATNSGEWATELSVMHRIDMLAAKLAAAYLVGATDALQAETARIIEARPRPLQPAPFVKGIVQASEESEPDATGFSGVSKPEREGLA